MRPPHDPAGSSVSMEVSVNGQPHTLPAASTLADLMTLLARLAASEATGSANPSSQAATATAVNGAFVSLHQRTDCVLHAGDQVTCFQLIVGG